VALVGASRRGATTWGPVALKISSPCRIKNHLEAKKEKKTCKKAQPRKVRSTPKKPSPALGKWLGNHVSGLVD